MRLVRVEIEGYRSVSDPVTLHLDPSVTILLGANDHGKSNLLEAITHLNGDKLFDAENDLNWDHADDPTKFPFLRFELELDDTDRANLLSLIAEIASTSESAKAPPPTSPPNPATAAATPPPPAAQPAPVTTPAASPTADSSSPATTATEPVPATETAPPAPPPLPPITINDMPRLLGLQKRGLAGTLTAIAFPESSPAFGIKGLATRFARQFAPRVELIRSQDTVPDAVGPEELKTEQHEFMRGIFYYAGLDASNAAKLFEQSDAMMMKLDKGSTELNKTLKANWSQGAELEYRLAHDSKSGHIMLRIKDPAVGGRLVRASQRSAGFTHFFTLKTVLYTRQHEHPANSYIFLFDEPGLYLHPAGQYDLLQVLDTIGRMNQVIYSTHSIFMLNKTFPTRHRLIVKTDTGTHIDGKPFVGRWGAAIEALGFSLAGTILFAQHILLTEGDSDPVLILAVLQKLASIGQANIDLNAFSVISTENSRNADALIRILRETAGAPRVAILVDGDEGGKARLKPLQTLLKAHAIPNQVLAEDTTVEDYMPLVGELYVRSVAEYVLKLMEAQGQKIEKPDDVRAAFRKSFKETFGEEKVTKGVAVWAANTAKTLGKLDQAPSKLGIAREYVKLLEATDTKELTPQTLQRPLKLLEWIQQMLRVPEVGNVPRDILRDSTGKT